MLIDYQYNYWNNQQYWAIGLPMICQLIIFWYWSNIVIANIESDPIDFAWQETLCIWLLMASAIYLITIELTAIYEEKHMYVSKAT